MNLSDFPFVDWIGKLSARDFLVFFSGSAATLYLSPKLAAAERNRQVVNRIQAVRARLIASLKTDALPPLERATQALEDCSCFFEPNTRLALEIVRLQTIYDYARQDAVNWTEARQGERRELFAKFVTALEQEHKSRQAGYYLKRRPFRRPRLDAE